MSLSVHSTKKKLKNIGDKKHHRSYQQTYIEKMMVFTN